MSPNLDIALCRDFPLLYRDRYRSMYSTAMCYGFDCGDGWEPIIRRLSEKLEPMIVAIADDEWQCSASQVKEKFGTLRFYMWSKTEEMTNAIQIAEDESSVTCEVCGAVGTLRDNGWLRTLCDEHHEI